MINIIKKDNEYLFLEEVDLTIGNTRQKIILELERSDKIVIAYDSEEELVISIFSDKSMDKEIQKVNNSYKKLGFDISKIKYITTNKIESQQLKTMQETNKLPMKFK